MKPWLAAAIVTGVVVATQALLVVLDSRTGEGDELPMLSPSASEVALSVASAVLVFGGSWLLFAVLRVKRNRRGGAQ